MHMITYLAIKKQLKWKTKTRMISNRMMKFYILDIQFKNTHKKVHIHIENSNRDALQMTWKCFVYTVTVPSGSDSTWSQCHCQCHWVWHWQSVTDAHFHELRSIYPLKGKNTKQVLQLSVPVTQWSCWKLCCDYCYHNSCTLALTCLLSSGWQERFYPRPT